MLDSMIFLMIGVMGVGGNAYYDYQAMQKRLEPYREQLHKIHGSCDKPKLELLHDAILAANNVDELAVMHNSTKIISVYGTKFPVGLFWDKKCEKPYLGLGFYQFSMAYDRIFKNAWVVRAQSSKEKSAMVIHLREIKEHLNKIAPEDLQECQKRSRNEYGEARSPACKMMHHINDFFRQNNCEIDQATKKYAAIKKLFPECADQATDLSLQKAFKCDFEKALHYLFNHEQHQIDRFFYDIRYDNAFLPHPWAESFKKQYEDICMMKKIWVEEDPDIEKRCTKDTRGNYNVKDYYERENCKWLHNYIDTFLHNHKASYDSLVHSDNKK